MDSLQYSLIGFLSFSLMGMIVSVFTSLGDELKSLEQSILENLGSNKHVSSKYWAKKYPHSKTEILGKFDKNTNSQPANLLQNVQHILSGSSPSFRNRYNLNVLLFHSNTVWNGKFLKIF